MKEEYLIQACTGKRVDVFKGQTITVIDVSGGQVADFFAESLDNAEEFLSTGVTMDCNESLRLKVEILFTLIYIGQCSRLWRTRWECMICSTHAVGLRCMIFSIKMERDTPTATIR